VFARLLNRPEGLLVATFVGLVLVGTIALRLGVCQTTHPIGLLDTLFTATSAVCVTGLITHDTATEFSRAGQIVILVLIQLGGLGVMTFGAVAFQLLRKRVSFQSHAAVQDLFFRGALSASLRVALRRIVLITFIFEALGAWLLYVGLHDGAAPKGGPFVGVFLAISAFCNAGFSVYSDSAVRLRDSHLIMGTMMTLIVVGGLGYTVLLEIAGRAWRALRRRREFPVVWSLNSRIVLLASAVLIGAGAAALLLTGLTSNERTVDIAALSVPSLMILIMLMFIGGSPGSCAGGIKTTSFCVWLARIRARLAGREDVTLADRRIPHEVVRRAALVIALATLWNVAGIMILALTEPVGGTLRLEQIIFEQISAFGTVGLSTGITPHLSALGKLWIIASMFAGRLGPLTIALAVIRSQSVPRFTYPDDRVMIG
jgi:trk system potassium uptake protein TrkH